MASDNKSLGRFISTASCRRRARAAGRGDVRPRRERHPQRLGARQGDRERAEDYDHGRRRALERRSREAAAEAELHAEEDRKRRDEIEIRNTADSLAYQAEKTVRENADKNRRRVKSEVDGKIAAVRSALQSADADGIRSATESLSETMQKIGQAVYGSQQAEQQPGGEPGAEGPAEEGTSRGIPGSVGLVAWRLVTGCWLNETAGRFRPAAPVSR